ncbi:hypothetical protein FRB95_003080 [Tulasnella sp. JGI-2019a]|nr:hypothetical protein FRB95_003080 [Tulasnella sp. JGI-2019a]
MSVENVNRDSLVRRQVINGHLANNTTPTLSSKSYNTILYQEVASAIQRHAHPILFVDELTVGFLEHLDRPESGIDNTDINAAGLTCKVWRDPSLTVKWREVHLKRLLSVLAPLRKSDVEGLSAVWVFAHIPTDHDDHSFRDIARRVHLIKYGVLLGESVFVFGEEGSSGMVPVGCGCEGSIYSS